MGIRKVSGGKRIDRWEQTVDGRAVPIDVYMAKVKSMYSPLDGGTAIDLEKANCYGYEAGTTVFHAICEEADVHLVSRDIGGLEKAVRKLVEERIAVEWRPMLVVTVKGDRPFVRTRRMRRDYDPTRALFNGDAQRTETSLSIEVEAVQIAEILGKKYHRETVPNDGYVRRPTRVHEGWPQVGDFTKPNDAGMYERSEGHAHGAAETVAMVPDTPENRAALIAVRQALENAARALDGLFHPDNVEATLRRALAAQPSVLALPAPGRRKGAEP